MKKIMSIMLRCILTVLGCAFTTIVCYEVIDCIFPPAEECAYMQDCICFLLASVICAIGVIAVIWDSYEK